MDSFILLLFLILWGLFHSLLASIALKDMIRIRLGARYIKYYRLSYNIFAALSFLPIIWLLFVLKDTQLYSIPKPWSFLFIFAQFLSFWVLVIGLKQTGALKFLGLNVLLGEKMPEEQILNISGLYKYVRHPLYSAGLVLMWCSPIMTTNSLIVSICLSIYTVIGALFEERKLIIDFGDKYQDYKKNVPMLIPFLKWNLK